MWILTQNYISVSNNLDEEKLVSLTAWFYKFKEINLVMSLDKIPLMTNIYWQLWRFEDLAQSSDFKKILLSPCIKAEKSKSQEKIK